MARYDGKLQAEREASEADMRLLVRSLESQGILTSEERQAAIVCLLSASEGWRDASDRLDGAFASESADETRLKIVKGE